MKCPHCSKEIKVITTLKANGHKKTLHSEYIEFNDMAEFLKYKDTPEMLFDLYINKDWSRPKLAEELGCSESTIQRRLNDCGIKKRRLQCYEMTR